ncbi:MAG TPA: CvpA family protein [Thermomicrobiales bacterium]
MDDYLILDILLGLIVVLFAAIGFWRGAAKEVVVTAGIFAGFALASSWASPWGTDLADLTDLRPDVAQLFVAAIALLSATILLGYAGSALAGSPDVSLGARVAGGVLAAINGVLLLHYLLSFIDRFIADEGAQRALDRSNVSRLLLRQFGWLLVGGAAVVALAIVVRLLVRRRHPGVPLVPATDVSEPATYQEADSRQRPVRLPRGADDGKYEPVARGYDSASGRYEVDAPSANETIPLPPVDASGLAYAGGSGMPSPNGQPAAWRTDDFAGDDWYRRAQAAWQAGESTPADERPNPNGQTQPEPQPPAAAANRVDEAAPDQSESGSNGRGSDEEVSALAWIRRSTHPGWIGAPSPTLTTSSHDPGPRQCRACAAELGESDRFCPRCGTPV